MEQKKWNVQTKVRYWLIRTVWLTGLTTIMHDWIVMKYLHGSSHFWCDHWFVNKCICMYLGLSRLMITNVGPQCLVSTIINGLGIYIDKF